MEQLKYLLDENVYTLYTTKLSDLKGLSLPNVESNVLSKSLFDFLINFSTYTLALAPRATLTTSETPYTITGPPRLVEDLRDIDLFLSQHTTSDKSNDLNDYLMNINKEQNSISDFKNDIRSTREALYTLLSRDTNYTRNLSNKRIRYYVMLLILLIISIVYLFTFYKITKTSLQNNIVGSLAATILTINMLYELISVFYVPGRVKESFAEPDMTVKISDPTHLIDNGSSEIDVHSTLAKFLGKYNEFMSFEVKAEYYESIVDKQAQDKKMLQQVNNENNVQKHFHELKNNLSYFKINEMKEYIRFVKYAVVLVSLIAMLYLSVKNKYIDITVFRTAASVTGVTFIIYVLLSIKSIMLRDKYDWDRMHWSINSLKSAESDNAPACDLPGR
jgi:hypothetical protein